MAQIWKMAIKDLRVLARDRMGAFFIVGFPIVMGLFFGLIMGGNFKSGSSAMKLAIIDQDQTEISKKFVDSLAANKSLQVETDTLEQARDSVRKGNRVGMLVIPDGFGETAGIFWATPPAIQLGMDPSRTAESGMLQGLIMEAIGGLAGERMSNPGQIKSTIDDAQQEIAAAEDLNPVNRKLLTAFFGTLDTMLDSMEELQQQTGPTEESGLNQNFQLANIESLDVLRELDPNSPAAQVKKLRSQWDISFPQAMMWGVLGCVAGFSISIARERTLGTMTRLEVAPVSRFHILAGKAVACFVTVLFVIGLLTALGVVLGMRPASYAKLAAAGLCVAFCFVGIMMMFSVLGKSEQSVAGVGWAINMIMAMLGGCMIPVMFMPDFIQRFSFLSPIKWGILAIEGAIWREFDFLELLAPFCVLIVVGVAGLLVGTAILSRRN